MSHDPGIVDRDLAARVAKGLNADVPEASPTAAKVRNLDASPALRIIRGPREIRTLKGRSVGVLIADGTDAERASRPAADGSLGHDAT